MPKSFKKAGGRLSGQRTISDTQADITLDDYANLKGNIRRLKKPTTNALAREVKKIHGSSNDNLNWYEKDLEDFDIDTEITSDLQLDEENVLETVTSTNVKKSKRGYKKGKKATIIENNNEGIEYPLDIWYILSEYIRPEDTATFACICKNSLAVVKSLRFWINLYKRYYKDDVALPERLQPECMERPHSLRACVVRSLYYLYPPFIERLQPTSPFDDGTHALIRSCCILMWHQKVKNHWNFYFKFRSSSNTKPNKPITKSNGRLDLLQRLDDVNANPEDGYQVLQVSCHNFISTPVVVGMFLVTCKVSPFNHYKLHLVFDSVSYNSYKSQSTNGIVIDLEPVANVRILNWWHPQYPYSSS